MRDEFKSFVTLWSQATVGECKLNECRFEAVESKLAALDCKLVQSFEQRKPGLGSLDASVAALDVELMHSAEQLTLFEGSVATKLDILASELVGMQAELGKNWLPRAWEDWWLRWRVPRRPWHSMSASMPP